jgi:Domain of unknown function (DUF4268)
LQLGRIVSVELRSIWKNEAGDFTPWLANAENLNLLGEALHLGELTLQSTERGVGDFSADIVAVDEGGVEVLIENQLEPTDHRHLGQVLTYLAGLNKDEASIVWLATRFRDEHRAAIDWLNRQTSDGFDFFGVEIEAIRIGDSDPAPRFNVVAMPNGWAKQASQTARRASSDTPSQTGTFYQEYWLGLRQTMEAINGEGRFPKAWPRHWLPFKIGRSGFQISVIIDRDQKMIRVELYMHQKDMLPKQAFRALEANMADIERDYGSRLDWRELPDRRASRIGTYLRDVDLTDRSDWPRQHRWVVDQLKEFRRVFSERVKKLELSYTPNDQGGDQDTDEMAQS